MYGPLLKMHLFSLFRTLEELGPLVPPQISGVVIFAYLCVIVVFEEHSGGVEVVVVHVFVLTANPGKVLRVIVVKF